MPETQQPSAPMQDGTRRRLMPSPAMIVALVALFVSLGGTAIAARHYLISSTKQIDPSILKKLKGKTGATGKTGPAGPTGPTGAAGAQGVPGKDLTAVTELPSGASESGGFAAGGGYDAGKKGEEKEDFGYIGTDITYPEPLSTPIADANIIDVQGGAGTTAPHCPGVGKADPGYLCLYNATPNDIKKGYGYSSTSEFSVPSPGVQIFWQVEAAGEPYAGGEWTVTAP